MRAWILLLITAIFAMANAEYSQTQPLFAFGEGETSAWTAVNDNVMGGLSAGGARITDGVLRFSGNLSLENNGGFSSIRHSADLDLSRYDGIRLRVRGDGRTYQLRLHTDARYFGRAVAFSGEFPTLAGEWSEVEVPFASLAATFRGRRMTNYTFDPEQVELIGILLADKTPGPFQLEIDRIQPY